LLDSGALYRLVAVGAQRAGLDPEDVPAHAALAERMAVRFGARPDGSERIELGGVDVTADVRSEAAGNGASRVAAWEPVRSALLQRQRDFARPPGLVADGRDMGTVVFPGAALKIFLTASADERAQRRYNQLKDKGSGVSLAALSREIAERDERDMRRALAPLKPANDAIVVDSTSLDIDQVVGRVLELARERGFGPK
jgi:cytidylate kinase